MYIVDGQAGIKDPTGMSGIRLEVQSHVIGVSTPTLKNLSKAITQAGLDIEGIVYSGIASAKGYLNKKQKEIGVILIDIGASNTSLAVFEENTLIHSKIIPIGSNHITNDIAIGLKIGLDSAEKIKINEINAVIEDVRENDKVDLSKYEHGEKEKPNRRYVCEIAEARLNELFGMIKDELKLIERDEKLPAGAILVGGGAKFNGLVQYVKNFLGLPAQIGHLVFEVSGIVDKLDDPEYACAVGLMLWGLDENQNIRSNKGKPKFDLGRAGGVLDRVKDVFKNLIP
jgi:cell division protein FtsA